MGDKIIEKEMGRTVQRLRKVVGYYEILMKKLNVLKEVQYSYQEKFVSRKRHLQKVVRACLN